MAERKFIKPAEGRNVSRNDNRKHLKKEGEWVDLDSYWVRRLKAGDVIAAEPPVKAKKPKGSAVQSPNSGEDK